MNILATIGGDDDEYSNAPTIGLSNDFVVTQNPAPDSLDTSSPTEIESKDLDDDQHEKLLIRCISSPLCHPDSSLPLHLVTAPHRISL